jgi:cobalt-zinc-cadmium efflux system membrane fusion protein
MRITHDPTPRRCQGRRWTAWLGDAVAIAVTIGTLACGTGEDVPLTDTLEQPRTGADSSMANMPGMKMPGDTAGGGDDTTAASSSERVAFTAAQIRNGRVQWAPAVLGTAAVVATVPGQLLPDEDRTARLGAPASGRVTAVRVRPGDRVTRGQALVTMQSPEAGVARADVTKAEAEVASRQAQATYARAARDRAERLLALKAIPRQDYERAIADDELARAALAQANAEHRRARSTADQLGVSATAAGEIVIRASLAGVVLERTATPGAVVEAGSPLVVISDPATLWLSIDAPEGLAAQFRVGETLHFTVPAHGVETFPARVDAVGAGLSPERRTLPIRAVVANRSGRFKAEMLATVLVAGTGSMSAVVLPEDAVQFLNGRTVVFIARPDSTGGATFVSREVQAGSRAGATVAVTAGLRAGEMVVTQGAFTVKAELLKSAMPKMEM